MTEKASIFKLILVILLIVITPLLFFRTVGENPLMVKENATQSIAIINEDMGIQEDAAEIQLGQEVASILEEGSNFDWTVVGRSAGENGLRHLKYDAIVYLPSDLSKNIMTYDEDQPVKTNFQYKVQSQLNAVNKQKVLVEVEKATKRVNQKISTLYWNYISADMENIRQEFDEILQQEVAFQETMTAFYKPSSKDLAGQIDEQKSMLTSLQSSIKQVGDRAPEQQSTMESYVQNLSSFVEYVDQYKEYQDKQQKLLAEIQAQSIQSVSQATENQQPMYIKTTNLFEEQGNKFLENIEELDQRMFSNQQVFSQLKENRYSQVERQISEFYRLQEKMIDFYQFYQQSKYTAQLNEIQGKLDEFSKDLNEGEGRMELPKPSDPPVRPETNRPEKPEGIENNDSDKNQESVGSLTKMINSSNNGQNDGNSVGIDQSGNLEEQLKLLNQTSEKIEELKGIFSNVESMQPDELNNAIEELIIDLTEIKENISKIEGELGKTPDLVKENTNLNERLKNLELYIDEQLNPYIGELEIYTKELESYIDELDPYINELESYIVELLEINGELEKEIELYWGYETGIISAINEIEKDILASPVLSSSRVEILTGVFNKNILSKDLLSMMYYYSYLVRYEETLNKMLPETLKEEKNAVLNNEDFKQEAKKIVEITSDEQAGWDQLGKDLPTTQDALTTMEDGFAVFMADYRRTVDDQQTKLVESLEGIQSEATKILEQIQQPQQMLTVIEPTPSVEGQEVISDSERIGEQMETIHTWMESISTSQSSIIDYTGELQGRVNDVQADADKLNNKWATNVASTEMIRDDVFSVLGNTFVDGQSNGYVYDFLTSPLKVSGDIPEENMSTNVRNIPPVVVLFIVLICSLLIGYTSYHFRQPPIWIKAILFVLLNIITGLVISIYGLDIYPLRESSAVEWTVFTILLLTAGSALIRVAFAVHHLVGLFVTVGMVVFYVTPLLALTTPNFSFSDPMSDVYMSIQYGTDSLFTSAVMVIVLILLGLGALQYFIGKAGTVTVEKGSETYEA